MRRPKFQVYQTNASQGIGGPRVKKWRWRLVAGKGEIVASGKGHTRKADAIRAAARLAALAEQAAARQPMILKAAKAINL